MARSHFGSNTHRVLFTTVMSLRYLAQGRLRPRCGSVTEYTQRKVKEMKYIKPTYKNEVIETSDIVLTSIIGGEAKLEATSSTSAKVSASVQSVLGSLYQ